MDTHRFKEIMDYGDYKLIQYGRKDRYICKKCSKDTENPIKTFGQEKHILRHLQDKHNMKLKLEEV